MKKRILFVTGTRADFGKLKALIKAISDSPDYECSIFATGMHLLEKYGYTITEITKSGFDDVFPYINQISGDDMEIILSNTISGLSQYLHEKPADMIVVHGDRVEALAGATVGALRNVHVAHVEGGEISGTVDELMRHAISKLSHVHFVATEEAKNRLVQLGECRSSIFHIGSPDVDAMLSESLPSLEKAKKRYQIEFDSYAIALLHPVTTESLEKQQKNAEIFVDAVLKSRLNYVIVYPNNDLGSQLIFSEYERLEGCERVKVFPSIRFEYFLVLLKSSKFIIGNSSAGIHEAPIYAVPTINVGNRQKNRFEHSTIFNLPFDEGRILETISELKGASGFEATKKYGTGESAEGFVKALPEVWNLPKQKQFNDLGV